MMNKNILLDKIETYFDDMNYPRNILDKIKLIINDEYNLIKTFDLDGLHIGSNDKDLIAARKYFGKKIIIYQ